MDVTGFLDLDSVSTYLTKSSLYWPIYRGQLHDDTTVAIKSRRSILPSLWEAKCPKLVDIWSKCSHPNIVHLIGKATFRGELSAVYMWHEYAGIIEYLEHYPRADPYQLSAQICDGVAYLHANDIVHGDLHRNQILVSSEGVPRIQLSLSTTSTITDASEDFGFRCWRPPELKLGSKWTFAGDVFALGMTILETITRGFPYGANTSREVGSWRAFRGEFPARPPGVLPHDNAGNLIWNLHCKCLSHDPEDRPSASRVRDVMFTVHQTAAGLALVAPKLVVTEQTTIEDLVLHYERIGLTNYTDLLLQTSILTTIPVADTALANVYRVLLPDQQLVAVKCVKHQTPYKRIKRSSRELACWLSHQHQNILEVLGFGVVKGDLAMISPWMKNGCVTDYVNKNPNADRLVICVQLARAITYLHKHNVVHGDIKSANVLISDVGRVKVMDFGVSAMDHKEIVFTVTSVGQGTQRWQAPEILLGITDSTKEGDVYALGMTLTEIYTGERPYGSMDWNFQTTYQVINGQLRPSRPVRLPMDDTGHKLWELMTLCWLRDPDERISAMKAYRQLSDIRKAR